MAAKADQISIDGSEGYNSIDFSDLPDNFRLSFEVLPRTSSLYYGIEFWTGSDNKKEGYELRFDPVRSKVGLHRLNGVFLQEDEWQSLYNVSGLDTQTRVEIIIYNDIFDICINRERTMFQRISKNGKITGFSVFAMCGAVRFSDVKLDRIVI